MIKASEDAMLRSLFLEQGNKDIQEVSVLLGRRQGWEGLYAVTRRFRRIGRIGQVEMWETEF